MSFTQAPIDTPLELDLRYCKSFSPAVTLPLEAVLAGGVADAHVPLGQDRVIVALRLLLVAVLVLPMGEVERVAVGVLVFDGPLKVIGVFALAVDVLVGPPSTWIEFDFSNSSAHRLILMIEHFKFVWILYRLYELAPPGL